MDATDFFTAIAERYGLLPVYALIVAFAGLTASSVRQLLTMLVIMTGVYVTMFRAFNLGPSLDIFGIAQRFNVPVDAANGVAAALFVFVLGFAIYGLKRLLWRPKPSE